MSTITSLIHPVSGFHTSSKSVIAFSPSSSLENCTLHLYFDLPPLIFVDPYELAHHSSSYTFKHWGATNLELPIAALPRENSELLLNVSYISTPPYEPTTVEVEVPLHARYGEPVAEGEAYVEAEIPWPKGFFACPTTSDTSSLQTSRPNMHPHFMSFFDPDASRFIRLAPTTNLTQNTLRVPVGSYSHLAVVETGTALCIVALFVYLLRVSWSTYRTLATRPKPLREKLQ